MYNKKNIAKGLIIGAVISNPLIDSMAKYDNSYNLLDTNSNPISLLSSKDKIKSKSLINKNIVKNSLLEITLEENESMPDLTGNPNGYETIIVKTSGSKKLSVADMQMLNKSTIPNIDLSNAQAISSAIANNVFNGNKNLVSFKFPKGVTSIGVYAFSGCTSLTGDLIIPEGITSIGSYAFNSCTGLNGILKLPSSLKTLSGNVFNKCSGLIGDLCIPEGVTTIGGNTFRDCSGLNGKLMLPDSLKTIGSYAFSGCSKLTGDLIIPDSVTSIEMRAFAGCSGFDGKLIIPNTVTNIGGGAFMNCSGFTGNLIIPDSVNTLGGSAFSGMSKVKKIYIKIDSSDIDTNYKESVISALPDSAMTVIDIPYDMDMAGTWLETTNKTLGKPVLKDISSGAENDLIENKGELVAISINTLYNESNISMLKDGEEYILPLKDSSGRYIFNEHGKYQLTITTDLGNTSIIDFVVYDKEIDDIVNELEILDTIELSSITYARELINSLPESSIKEELQLRLSSIFPDITFEKQTATSNIDVYIKSENMLSLSVDTAKVSFEDYSGVRDEEYPGVINLSINSSLPYKINSYLATEIKNSEGSEVMDSDILNIKASNIDNYESFTDINTPIVLLDNQPQGNDNVVGIDLMLKGSLAHKADVYKTVLKFEVEQK